MFLIAFLWVCSFSKVQDSDVSAVYGGGPFYLNPSVTISEVRTSGFNAVVVWTIHIDSKGNLDLNAEFPIVANGTYAGHNKYPSFSKNMALLKTVPTSVTRLEFGLSAAGSSTFTNINALIASQTNNQFKGAVDKIFLHCYAEGIR